MMADLPDYDYVDENESSNNSPISNPNKKILITEQNAHDLLKTFQ